MSRSLQSSITDPFAETSLTLTAKKKKGTCFEDDLRSYQLIEQKPAVSFDPMMEKLQRWKQERELRQVSPISKQSSSKKGKESITSNGGGHQAFQSSLRNYDVSSSTITTGSQISRSTHALPSQSSSRSAGKCSVDASRSRHRLPGGTTTTAFGSTSPHSKSLTFKQHFAGGGGYFPHSDTFQKNNRSARTTPQRVSPATPIAARQQQRPVTPKSIPIAMIEQRIESLYYAFADGLVADRQKIREQTMTILRECGIEIVNGRMQGGGFDAVKLNQQLWYLLLLNFDFTVQCRDNALAYLKDYSIMQTEHYEFVAANVSVVDEEGHPHAQRETKNLSEETCGQQVKRCEEIVIIADEETGKLQEEEVYNSMIELEKESIEVNSSNRLSLKGSEQQHYDQSMQANQVQGDDHQQKETDHDQKEVSFPSSFINIIEEVIPIYESIECVQNVSEPEETKHSSIIRRLDYLEEDAEPMIQLQHRFSTKCTSPIDEDQQPTTDAEEGDESAEPQYALLTRDARDITLFETEEGTSNEESFDQLADAQRFSTEAVKVSVDQQLRSSKVVYINISEDEEEGESSCCQSVEIKNDKPRRYTYDNCEKGILIINELQQQPIAMDEEEFTDDPDGSCGEESRDNIFPFSKGSLKHEVLKRLAEEDVAIQMEEQQHSSSSSQIKRIVEEQTEKSNTVITIEANNDQQSSPPQDILAVAAKEQSEVVLAILDQPILILEKSLILPVKPVLLKKAVKKCNLSWRKFKKKKKRVQTVKLLSTSLQYSELSPRKQPQQQLLQPPVLSEVKEQRTLQQESHVEDESSILRTKRKKIMGLDVAEIQSVLESCSSGSSFVLQVSSSTLIWAKKPKKTISTNEGEREGEDLITSQPLANPSSSTSSSSQFVQLPLKPAEVAATTVTQVWMRRSIRINNQRQKIISSRHRIEKKQLRRRK